MPTWFVNGEERRAAYYTVQARELKARGFAEEGEKAVAKKPLERQPEILVEAGGVAYDSELSIQEPMGEEDKLEDMTKAELLEWAMDKGHDLLNNALKSEIFAQCKEIEASL